METQSTQNTQETSTKTPQATAGELAVDAYLRDLFTTNGGQLDGEAYDAFKTAHVPTPTAQVGR